MQHRKKNKKEYQLLEREGKEKGKENGKGKENHEYHKGDENTRWHEGHTHHEGEQHYHHLTLPSLADIETDDAEFVDPTESM